MKAQLRAAGAALLALAAASCAVCPDQSAPTAALCTAPDEAIDEQAFWAVGGIEQWVTIKGSRCDNPVILMLHGGPGNPLSPYTGTIYAGWEKSFTLVQWDQRGAGRTYGRSPPTDDSALTLARMTDDGNELAAQIAKRLGKKQIILMGGSWGSILGVHMIKSEPDLFSAYVGISQIVRYSDNQSASYSATVALARAAGDTVTGDRLAALGAPPWTDPRSFGVLRRALRPYEAKVSAPAPSTWWAPAPVYDTPKDAADFETGEEYSFLQFVGLNGDGMFSKVDLPQLGLDFSVPVFLVHGSEDLVASPDVASAYFERITAPDKAFILVPAAGHDPNEALIAAQLKVLTERIRPEAPGSPARVREVPSNSRGRSRPPQPHR